MTTPSRFPAATNSTEDAIYKVEDQVNMANNWSDASAAAGTITVTAAQMVNGSHRITSGAASTVTTDTATAIIAALGAEVQVGTKFDFLVVNGGSGTYTMSGGTGVTITGLAAVPTLKNMLYKGFVTNVVTPAVTLLALQQTGGAGI